MPRDMLVNSPLKTMSMSRIQLDAYTPTEQITKCSEEALLYGLIGDFSVYAHGRHIGTFTARHDITEHRVTAIRFPAMAEYTIQVILHGHAADLLYVTRQDIARPEDVRVTCAMATRAPYIHYADGYWHVVGKGTHERTVFDLPTPEGYAIYAGETHNIPGGISSWPPHASHDDLLKFQRGETSWEEVMFFIGNGFANLQGIYANGQEVDRVIRVDNGSAHVMPLGSHAIHALPGQPIRYIWAYTGNALQKTYNAVSTDLGTYRK